MDATPMKPPPKFSLTLMVMLLSLVIIVAIGVLLINFHQTQTKTDSTIDQLTQEHHAEFEPAIHKFYSEQYDAYVKAHPKTNMPFNGKILRMSVLTYTPRCSIVQAQYQYAGMTLISSY